MPTNVTGCEPYFVLWDEPAEPSRSCLVTLTRCREFSHEADADAVARNVSRRGRCSCVHVKHCGREIAAYSQGRRYEPGETY